MAKKVPKGKKVRPQICSFVQLPCFLSYLSILSLLDVDLFPRTFHVDSPKYRDLVSRPFGQCPNSSTSFYRIASIYGGSIDRNSDLDGDCDCDTSTISLLALAAF